MYTITNTTQALGASMTDIIVRMISFLPSILMALILVVLGVIFGGILGRAVSHLISLLKVDRAIEAAGVHEMINGVKFSVSKLLGGIVKWTVIISFLMTATQTVGLSSFAGLLWQLIAFIPNVIVAALILVASLLLADFVSKLVAGSSKVAGLKSNIGPNIARYAIIIFGVIAALTQLNIAGSAINILFAGMVFSISLALGLAFGLGGREAAAKMIEKLDKEL
ncbi:MAG: hypothetical protein QG614_377 [Patescibacteria group bacterium]|nr:hypothetical protein [Patescibacteria group bacterium]